MPQFSLENIECIVLFCFLWQQHHCVDCDTEINHLTSPSGKLPFECQKIAKNLTFFSKQIDRNCNFFHQNCQFSGGSVRCTSSESVTSDCGPNWGRLVPKWTIPRLFQGIFQYILSRRDIRKRPGFVPSGAILTQFGPQSDLIRMGCQTCLI